MSGVGGWISDNKLKSIGLLWGSTVGASIAYQWKQNIPTSLKIIHSRVYAQAVTLGALALVAAVDIYEHRDHSNNKMDLLHSKLQELEAKLTGKGP
ncbi:hypothetical protein WJX73_003075 [Symbiochloris irregularis]|uniref:HIG1 domain-containing protein n=1 Tax=Symbiochloris irregularis TaxID=706552 RepID=A0AAW1NN24_9CHLO